MRNIGPEGFIPVHEIKGRSKAFALNAHPDGVDIVRRQLTTAAGVVQFAFEIIKGDLADDRVDHVFNLARQQNLAFGVILGLVEHLAEGQHFTEYRCGFCQCQRR